VQELRAGERTGRVFPRDWYARRWLKSTKEGRPQARLSSLGGVGGGGGGRGGRRKEKRCKPKAEGKPSPLVGVYNVTSA